MPLEQLCREERVYELLVLTGRQRRVQEVVAAALAVARHPVEQRVIQGVAADDGRDGIVERKRVGAEPRGDRLAQPVGGERPGGHDAGGGQLGHLFAHHGDARVVLHPAGHLPAELHAVHGERGAARNARGLRHLHQKTAQDAQLGLQQAVRVG